LKSVTGDCEGFAGGATTLEAVAIKLAAIFDI